MLLLSLLVPYAAFGGSVNTTHTMAIWRLKPLGLDENTAERLEGLLRTEAGRLNGIKLQDKQETLSRLAAHTNLQACGGKTSCLCQIGKILRVDRLVTGVIGALGDDYTFDLKLLDVASCRESRRINEALSGREDLLIAAIRKALYKLVAPELVVGSLLVNVPVKGATILVDDKEVGKTPLAKAISGLRPGLHRLKIQGEGFSEFTEDVPVRFQQTTMLKVDLVKSVLTGLSYEKEKEGQNTKEASSVSSKALESFKAEPTSTLRVLAWTTTGLAVVAAAAAGVLTWRSKVAEHEVEQAANSDPPYINSSYDAVLNRGRTYSMWSNISWGLAGAAAIGSVIMFIVDLSSDNAQAEDSQDPRGKQDPSVVISPVFGTMGGQINLKLNF